MLINSTLQLTLQHHKTQPLESIYHTFKFIFSVRPEVKLDVLPCGLDRICEQPRATKLTQRLTELCVSPSLQTNVVTPAATYNSGARYHKCLNDGEQCLSGAISDSARQVSPIPACDQQRPTLLHATYYNYTFTC